MTQLIERLSVLALATLVAACGSRGLCANTVERRLPSPNGSHEVVVFIRDCGATTDYSSQVALLSRGASPRDLPGNVFIAPHRTDVQVQWIAEDTLLVQHGTPDPVRKADQV